MLFKVVAMVASIAGAGMFPLNVILVTLRRAPEARLRTASLVSFENIEIVGCPFAKSFVTVLGLRSGPSSTSLIVARDWGETSGEPQSGAACADKYRGDSIELHHWEET